MSVKLNIKTNSLKDLGLELREIRKKRKPKSNTTTSSNNVKSSNPYMSSYGYTSPNTSNVSSIKSNETNIHTKTTRAKT